MGEEKECCKKFLCTKTKLLDAAEELFIQNDYDSVSVRELAAAADVNIAAINYHFQGKENLYREVILRRFVSHRDQTLKALEKVLADSDGKPQLEHIIGTLVRQHLAGTLTESGSAPFMGLIVREMHAGHKHVNSDFLKQMIAPVFKQFSKALIVAKPNLKQDDVSWIMGSVIGQVIHFIVRRKKFEDFQEDSEAAEIMLQALPALSVSTEDYIEAVTEHISCFSTAAIKSMYPEVE